MMRSLFTAIRNRLSPARRASRSRRLEQSLAQPLQDYRQLRFQALESRDLMSVAPLGAEFRVNTATQGDQGWSNTGGTLARTIGMSPNGDFVVAWNDDPYNYQISARRFNAQGTPQGDQFIVNLSTDFRQANPSVAMDAAGNFVVIWNRDSRSGAGVLGQRYSAAGVPLGSEFAVTSTPGAPDGYNAVAMDVDGDFVVVWDREGGDGDNESIFGQRFNSSGIKQGGEFLVNTYTLGDQYVPQVAMDAAGNFTVIWVSDEQDGSGTGVYGQCLAADGSRLADEFRVSVDTEGEQSRPSIAMNLAGEFVVTWDNYDKEILARNFHSSGLPVGFGDLSVEYNSTNVPWYPRAAINGDGDFVVTWEAINLSSSAESNIFAQTFDSRGAQVGDTFRVNTYTSRNQTYPSVAADYAGNFTIVWSSSEQDGSGWGVYGQRFAEMDSPLLGFAIGDATVTEGPAGTKDAVFTVTLYPEATETATVTFRTQDSSAQQSTDYLPTSGTLTFTPGSTTATITVAIVGDAVIEQDEQFSVVLNDAVNATYSKWIGRGYITDDDADIVLDIQDTAAVLEGNSGTTNAVFLATLSAAATQDVVVRYFTSDDAGRHPTDLPYQTGTVTFAPGEMSRTITIAITGDTQYEPDDGFRVMLYGIENAVFGKQWATGLIMNDDPMPTVSISDVTVLEGASGTVNAITTVTLTSSSADLVIVPYVTSDDTAVAPGDYVAKAGVLTFAPGETSKQITVVVNGDALAEPNERFKITLTSPTNTILNDATAAVTILSDDGPLPTIEINDITVIEGDSGTRNAVFTISLSDPFYQEVAVNYATYDGFAFAYFDYIPTGGLVTFAPQTTSQSVTVAVYGEVEPEDDEPFEVYLYWPANATLGDSRGTATILNDDLGWHNYANPPDVNHDGAVSAIDLLHVADALNTYAGEDGFLLWLDPLPIWMIDVDDDFYISAIDLVLVVDELNKAQAPNLNQFAPLAEAIDANETTEASSVPNDEIALGLRLSASFGEPSSKSEPRVASDLAMPVVTDSPRVTASDQGPSRVGGGTLASAAIPALRGRSAEVKATKEPWLATLD